MSHSDMPIAQLYAERKNVLLGYLLGFLGNRASAEEALQQTFASICRRLKNAPDAKISHAYLFRAARHEALRIARERATETADQFAHAFLLNPPEADEVEREERARLQNAISRLPEEQREVVLLRAYDALHFEEIAEALEIPIKTAISRYRLALEKLRAMLVKGE